MTFDVHNLRGLTRRGFALWAAIAAALPASVALAQTHDHSKMTKAASAPKRPLARKPEGTGKYQAVVNAAKVCKTRGETCRAHCIKLIRSGDKSLEECLRRVNATLAVCEATGRLAANESDRFKDLAKVCLDVCTDCEAECKKHAGHHAECKGCMEACTAMIGVLKPLLG